MFRIPQACATSCHRFPMLQWRQAPTGSSTIEVHPNPSEALSDGPQQLTPAQFRELVEQLREIAAVFGKKIV